MAKKITNTFYNIDYYAFEPIRKLPDTAYVMCTLLGETTQEKMAKLEAIEGFKHSADDLLGEVCWQVECGIPKGKIKELKEAAKGLGLMAEVKTWDYMFHEIPGGYLYSGWKTGRKTKIRPEDLPGSYVYVSNYKKHGYVQTAGVKGIRYKPSPFHNHAFKDDFLYISYSSVHDDDGAIDGAMGSWDKLDSWDEYIFGNDIVDVLFGIEKNNDDAALMGKVQEIKGAMAEQYNAYVDECGGRWGSEKIGKLEDLKAGSKKGEKEEGKESEKGGEGNGV